MAGWVCAAGSSANIQADVLVAARPLLHAIDIGIRGGDLGDPPTSVQIPREVARGRPCPALLREPEPGHTHDPGHADLDPMDGPGHQNRYVYRSFYRRRMDISRGVWESHNPRTLQVEAPDARSAPPRSAPTTPPASHATSSHSATAISATPCPPPTSGTTRSCRGRSSSCRPVGRAPTSPLHGPIVALDDRTVGHTPGSTTPSHGVLGARSASAVTG